MGQPVKLSDALIMEARLAGESMERSIAGQVEFWATMGRALELVTTRTQLERLRQRAAMPLSEIVATIDEPAGRARLQAHLDERPYPRFVAHPTLPRTFCREDRDGTRILGRFKQGVFHPVPEEGGTV
jgi:hypothetical protein